MVVIVSSAKKIKRKRAKRRFLEKFLKFQAIKHILKEGEDIQLCLVWLESRSKHLCRFRPQNYEKKRTMNTVA